MYCTEHYVVREIRNESKFITNQQNIIALLMKNQSHEWDPLLEVVVVPRAVSDAVLVQRLVAAASTCLLPPGNNRTIT